MLVLVVLVSLAAFYLAIGARSHESGASNDRFFLMDRGASTSQYVDTTIAYSLQVAVTVYFVYWGYAYGWANAGFIGSWAVGILLFAMFVPRLVPVLDANPTFISFVASDSTSLRYLSCFLLCLTLVGLLYTELFFSTQYLTALVQAASARAVPGLTFWLIFFVLVAVTISYCSLGGMAKVVVTDKWQLSLAYVSSALFLVALQPFVAERGAGYFYWVYVPALLLYLALALSPVLLSTVEKQGFNLLPREVHSSMPVLACWASAALIMFAILGADPVPDRPVSEFPKGPFSMFREAYGIWPLLGFGLSNLVWQFGDYTAYHRLSIMSLESGSASRARLLRRAVLYTMLSSPLSWSIGILAGMAIDASGLVPDAGLSVFSEFVLKLFELGQQGSVDAYLCSAALAVFIINVLFSTADSAFLSIGQILGTDLPRNSHLEMRRIVVLVALAAVMILFGVVHLVGEINVFDLMSTVYAWGLIFAPGLLYRTYARSPSTLVLLIALSVSAGTSSWMAFNPLGLPPLVSLVFPSMSGIILSAMLIALGHALSTLAGAQGE